MFNLYRVCFLRSDQPGRQHQVGHFAGKSAAHSAVNQFIARLRAEGGVSAVYKLREDHYRAIHPDGDKFIDLLIEAIAVAQQEELQAVTP